MLPVRGGRPCVLLAGASLARPLAEPHPVVGAIGAAVFAGILLVLHLVSPAGLGFGDVKLGVLLGLYLGAVQPQRSCCGACCSAPWPGRSSRCPSRFGP